MSEINKEINIGSSWEAMKANGSDHYKTGGVEPIDLYRAGGAFVPFALCSIIKYAFRSITKWRKGEPVLIKDMDKIIDYASKVKADAEDTK